MNQVLYCTTVTCEPALSGEAQFHVMSTKPRYEWSGQQWRVRGGALLLTLTLAAAVMTHVLPTGASVSSLQW